MDTNILKGYDPDNYFPDECAVGMMLVNKNKKNYSD